MITKPIRVLQLNANRQNAVIHALLNSATADDSADIVLITEPWWGNIGNDMQGPVSETAAGWTPILPVTPIKKDQRPRAMAYTRRRKDFTVTLRSDIANDLDLQVLEVAQATHPSTLLVNIYNDDKKQGRHSAAKRLQNLALPREAPVIISGDWNLHHPLWSRSAEPAKDSTEQTADWLVEQGYTIKNTKGEPTFFSHTHKTWSTIDLTFTNPAATELDAAQGWHIDNESSFGSDHLALRWNIDYGATEIENVTGERYNFKDTDPAKWRNAFRDALLTHAEALDPLQSAADTLTTDTLDAAANALTAAMQDANLKTAKIRKPSDRARPWWNHGLQDAAKKTADLRAESLAHVQRWGTQAKAVNAMIKKSRNYFKRLYKTARRRWITETLEQAETPDIWRFMKWGKGTRTYASPAISRGPDRNPAISHADKCDALRDELFQPPPPLEDDYRPDLDNLHEDLPHEDVTREEVRSSIFDQGADKAPGLSQCPFRTIRWAWDAAPDMIHALMNHCLRAGYHPQAWRKAIAVAIPKPGKPDYSNPRAYRLIQLLECMGKVLERIVANRLAYLVATHNLVPANQFGGRPASSTDDAILTFTHDIEAAHNHDRVTSALTFDIKGFFDFVNHGRLLSVMRAKRIPLQLVRWTAAFLSNREAAICLDGVRGQMQAVQNGIPQGSPTSPILSIIYATELLEIFEQAAWEHMEATTSGMCLADDPSPTQLIMYIDDGTIYVSSKSLDMNTRILQ